MKKLLVFAFLCDALLCSAQVFEQFNNTGLGSAYLSGTFVGDRGITWHFVNARGNQKVTQNGDKAISLNKAATATLYSESIPQGIRRLAFLYEQAFSTYCDFLVFVNDSCIANLTTNAEKGITKSFSADVFFPEPVVIAFRQASGVAGQVTIDDVEIQFAETPPAPEVDTSSSAPNTFAKPRLHSVVITEIMADPSPTVGLPEYEYVEIFNTTDSSINCADLQLTIGNSAVALPDTILPGNSYIYICTAKARDEFPAGGLFLPSLPAIANDGKTIALSHKGEIISSVTFSKQWYHDAFKSDGGWSLEKIDVENLSETEDNWTAASGRKGGSPGAANTVARTNDDNQPPFITHIVVENDTTLAVSFSENLAVQEVAKALRIVPQCGIADCQPVGNSLSQFSLHLASRLTPNSRYTLLLDALADFAGNVSLQQEYVFAPTDSVLTRNSILINELLFNPKPGDSDFVELYNNSASYFDLSQLCLSNGTKFLRIAEQFTLFPPHSYAVISPDAPAYQAAATCGNAVFVTATLPTMPDDEGIIILYNLWEDVIDSLSYSKTWHSPYLADDEGVSLERVNFSSPSNQRATWLSAAETAGFSTPGCENSQFRTEPASRGEIALDTDVVTPDGDDENDALHITFSDIDAGTLCTIRICTTNGRLTRLLASNQLLASNDAIRWDGTDSHGTLVPAGIYIIVVELLKDGRRISKEKRTVTVLR